MQEYKLIINASPSEIHSFEARSFIDKLKGFMFIKKPGYALLLKSTNSIHSFFMRFSIDVLFLDKDNKIVKIEGNIQPGRVFLPVISASKVLELPTGLVDISKFKIGDIIDFRKM